MRDFRASRMALLAAALVAAPPALAAAGNGSAPARAEMTVDGPVLVTPAGMTLYIYRADEITPGKSQCTGERKTEMGDVTGSFPKYFMPGHKFVKSCLDVWHPYLAPAGSRPSGDWTLLDRPEGRQWMFRDRPLYTSIRDKQPGDRNGAVDDEFTQRDFELALAPLNLPGGLKLTRYGEDLVLATADGRIVHTPKDAAFQRAAAGQSGLFQPVTAPMAARSVALGRDWSTNDTGGGAPQLSFKGAPLFAPEPGLSARDIAQLGNWRPTVYQAGNLPPQIHKHPSLIGTIYTNAEGRTLYYYICTGMGCDLPGGAATYFAALCGSGQECARRWRPYLAAPGAKPVGDWSIIDVPDPLFSNSAGQMGGPELPRAKAWAYRARPVFTFHQDKEPGDLFGHKTQWFGFSQIYAIQVPGMAAE